MVPGTVRTEGGFRVSVPVGTEVAREETATVPTRVRPETVPLETPHLLKIKFTFFVSSLVIHLSR